MEEKIKDLALSRLTNSGHAELFLMLLDTVAKYPVVSGEAAGTLKVLRRAFDKEFQIFTYVRRKDYTLLLRRYDRMRDFMHTSIKTAAHAYTLSPDIDVAQAAQKVYFEIVAMKIKQRAQYLAKCAPIRALAENLTGALGAETARLGLTRFVETMEEANCLVEHFVDVRTLDHAQMMTETMESARRHVDNAFRRFAEYINALMLVGRNEELACFVEEVNGTLALFRRKVLGGRRPGAKRADEAGEVVAAEEGSAVVEAVLDQTNE